LCADAFARIINHCSARRDDKMIVLTVTRGRPSKTYLSTFNANVCVQILVPKKQLFSAMVRLEQTWERHEKARISA